MMYLLNIVLWGIISRRKKEGGDEGGGIRLTNISEWRSGMAWCEYAQPQRVRVISILWKKTGDYYGRGGEWIAEDEPTF